MARSVLFCLASGLTVLLATASALSQECPDYKCELVPKRIALVIGNRNYAPLSPIESAKPDAEMMAERLRDLGFDVDYYPDVQTLFEFNEKIIPAFRSKFTTGDFVFFYFSGHGFGYGSDNFLAPISMPLSIPEEKVSEFAISVDAFKGFVASQSPGLIVFAIDACRTYPGFVIRNADSKNVVGKGPNPTNNQHKTINSFILYATRPGEIAAGFDAPGRLSTFTQAMINSITTEGQPFRSVFDEIASEVRISTNDAQQPGKNDFSQTDPYLKPTAKNLEDERESWRGTLGTQDTNLIKKFFFRHSVSLHAFAARKWIADNLSSEQASRFTRASPAAIDRAWRPGNEGRVSVRRSETGFAFDRALDESQEQALREFSESELGLVPSGTPRQKIAQLKTGERFFLNDITTDSILVKESLDRSLLAFSLSNLDAHRMVVTTQGFSARQEPSVSSPVVRRIAYGTQLRINDVVFGPDEDIWLSASTAGRESPLYLKVEHATPLPPLELGQSIREIIALPRANSIPDLVDTVAIEGALADLMAQGWKITWVSLSTASTNDASKQDARAARMVNAEYILKRAGIDGRRITSVSGREDFSGDGVRVRVFGFPKN